MRKGEKEKLSTEMNAGIYNINTGLDCDGKMGVGKWMHHRIWKIERNSSKQCGCSGLYPSKPLASKELITAVLLPSYGDQPHY